VWVEEKEKNTSISLMLSLSIRVCVDVFVFVCERIRKGVRWCVVYAGVHYTPTSIHLCFFQS